MIKSGKNVKTIPMLRVIYHRRSTAQQADGPHTERAINHLSTSIDSSTITGHQFGCLRHQSSAGSQPGASPLSHTAHNGHIPINELWPIVSIARYRQIWDMIHWMDQFLSRIECISVCHGRITSECVYIYI